VHPDDLLHVNGPAREVHNLYGHVWAQVLYEGYRRDFPRRRPLILMRSGFIGSQRFGLIPWSGDVNRSWGGLKPQVEIALSMGLQGLAYMHSDLGGFAGDYKDAELYIRWLQYGVFQPIYRTHAQESVPAEPVLWDDTTKRIVRRYLQWRYALLPYNYTLAWENHTTGLPLMRPLGYLDDDPDVLTNTTSYLWGNAFLVSPVVEKGAFTQTVHFPKGATWIDFWSGQVYHGGQAVAVPVTIEHIPVFVRAGAFVPMCDKPLWHTEQYDPKAVAVHYYHHPTALEGAGMLYEDDGQTPDAVAQKAYSLLRFTAEYREARLTLRHQQEGYRPPAWPQNRVIKYVVHGLPGTPKTAWRIARGSGKTSPLRYFREMNTLVFYLREETDKEAVIEF
jgi:oligosaccharide 4-alpha-D-glucosyltransferase